MKDWKKIVAIAVPLLAGVLYYFTGVDFKKDICQCNDPAPVVEQVK